MNVPGIGPTRVRDHVAVALAIGAFAALAILVWHTSQPLAWERPIISALRPMPFPTRSFWIGIFEPVPFALLTLALACAVAARGRFRLALGGLAGCFSAVVAAELVIKPIVGRVRAHDIGWTTVRIVHFGGAMFPSAHVTAATAFATFAFLALRSRSRLAGAVFVVPVVVGAAVVSKRMHDPADVLGGLILGPLVVAWIVATVYAAGTRLGLERLEPRRARDADPVSSGTA